MTTRKITGSQLRGMIREALEESVVEIQLDEQIAALRAKGGRRSLQETKRYRKLLEMKMEMVDEAEQPSSTDPKSEDQKGVELSGKAAFIASKFEEGAPLRKALDDAAKMSVVQRVELLAMIADYLSFDTTGEMSKLFAEIKERVREHQDKMSNISATEAEAGVFSGDKRQLSLPESRRRLIRRR